MFCPARRIIASLVAFALALSPWAPAIGEERKGPEVKLNVSYEGYTIRFSDGSNEDGGSEGKPRFTIKELTRQIDEKPSPKAYSERALLQALGGNVDCGLSDMEKAIAMDPSWRLYLMRSLIYRIPKKKTQARIDVESALLVASADDAAAASAIAGMMSEPDEGSLERLTKAVELEPKNADYLLMRAHRSLYLGKPREAIADIKAATKLGHESAFARFYLCQAHSNAGDWATALVEYEQAYEKYPQNLSIAWSRANFLMKASPRLKENESLLDSAIRCCDLTEWEDADALMLLGAAYEKDGDKEAAVEAYGEAEEFADDSQLEKIADAIERLE